MNDGAPRPDVPTLIRELLDKSYDPGFFRDDCAMYLADSDEPAALQALLRVAADPEDECLHDQAGESIADIVKRHPERGAGLAEQMAPRARDAYLHSLKAN